MSQIQVRWVSWVMAFLVSLPAFGNISSKDSSESLRAIANRLTVESKLGSCSLKSSFVDGVQSARLHVLVYDAALQLPRIGFVIETVKGQSNHDFINVPFETDEMGTCERQSSGCQGISYETSFGMVYVPQLIFDQDLGSETLVFSSQPLVGGYLELDAVFAADGKLQGFQVLIGGSEEYIVPGETLFLGCGDVPDGYRERRIEVQQRLLIAPSQPRLVS